MGEACLPRPLMNVLCSAGSMHGLCLPKARKLMAVALSSAARNAAGYVTRIGAFLMIYDESALFQKVAVLHAQLRAYGRTLKQNGDHEKKKRDFRALWVSSSEASHRPLIYPLPSTY